MYEVWVSNEDPTFHLVQKVDPERRPDFFDPSKWSQVGTLDKVSPRIAHEIENTGFATASRNSAVLSLDEAFG